MNTKTLTDKTERKQAKRTARKNPELHVVAPGIDE